MTLAVVIPCYKVRDHVLDVLASVSDEVSLIYCVDDACPERSGDLIERHVRDPRVRVLRHRQNAGVGGATLTGYGAAIADGADVIVKIDGDGQMDPALIPLFSGPIAEGLADYTKGNRFFNVEDTRMMPRLRLFGNSVLSFMTKISSGYWQIFDPTNGYTAIHSKIAARIITRPINHRYFFESDMLFHLYMERAVVMDIPMEARYADERSSLNIRDVVSPFIAGNFRNAFKRVLITYFVRDFSIASVELVLGIILLSFGVTVGLAAWGHSIASGVTASAGTVMLAALPIILGFQLFLSAINYDIQNVPRFPIHKVLAHGRPAETPS